jgi:photosystem II stability/assembly factor-like uncharacterized protein
MSGERIAVGTRKGLLLFEKGNAGWKLGSEHFSGVRCSYSAMDPRSNALFACLDHGHWGAKLSRSRDEGKTWQEIPSPKYPEGEIIRGTTPAVLKYLWCLTFGTADQPGRLYLGTIPGGLFVSDDDGDSLRLVESLWKHPSRIPSWFGGGADEAGIHSVLIDPRDSLRLRVAVSCAGVFLGEPDGNGDWSWTATNQGLKADFLPNPDAEIGHDPHLLVQCQSQPDMLWQQNHCGIFRSTDSGQNWKQLTKKGNNPHFGFAVAVDPRDGNTAWVIPAESDEVRSAVGRKLCVCRTTDGGEIWQEFRTGLPQENCFDFAFRHCLDLAGNRLVFGTACGSLYVSEDRGETWQSLGSHLPPVYSVRFC